MMNLSARMPSVDQARGRDGTEIKIIGDLLLQMIDQGNLIDSPQQVIQKLDYDRSWSCQEWKSEVTAHDRSGKPDKTSWNAMQQVRPHHGDTLLDGNAHSVRYGEMIHDGSGKPEKFNYQEEAIPKLSSWAVTQQNL